MCDDDDGDDDDQIVYSDALALVDRVGCAAIEIAADAVNDDFHLWYHLVDSLTEKKKNTNEHYYIFMGIEFYRNDDDVECTVNLPVHKHF